MDKEIIQEIVKNYIAEHYVDINNVNLGDSAIYVSKDISIKNNSFDKYEDICKSIKL